MEDRIAKLEDFAIDARERLARIESRLDQTASKADLRELEAKLIKWIVGTLVAASVTAITIMTFVLNNAVPKPVPSPPAPIVIYLPAPPPQR
jgi:hypothetical protein